MKRILPLVLTVLLLPTLLAVPAMAEENEFWYELLDYGYSQYGSNHITLDSVTQNTRKYIRYENPLKSVLSYFDIVFRTDDTSPRIVSSSSWLTVVNIGDNLWRAYGRSGIVGAYFYLEYDDGTYIDVLSFKATPVAYDSYQLNVSGELFNYAESDHEVPYTFSYLGDDVASSVEFPALSEFDNTFLAEMALSDWTKYDYVDLHFAVWGNSVNSVSAYTTDGSMIPVEVNTLQSGVDANTALYVLTVRCDLSEVLRQDNQLLIVAVSGSLYKGEFGKFTIYRASGLILPVTDNFLVYWFGQLKTWLDSGFSSIVDALGGSNDGSQVQDNINAAVGELDQVQNVMDGVTRPALDSINFDISGMMDTAAVSTYGNIFATLTGNQYMTNLLLIAFILAAASFLLFGRR